MHVHVPSSRAKPTFMDLKSSIFTNSAIPFFPPISSSCEIQNKGDNNIIENIIL